MKRSILDNDAAVEYHRLDLMSRILDPSTQRHLTALGFDRGWQRSSRAVGSSCRSPTSSPGALYFQLFFEIVHDRVVASGLLNPWIHPARTASAFDCAEWAEREVERPALARPCRGTGAGGRRCAIACP